MVNKNKMTTHLVFLIGWCHLQPIELHSVQLIIFSKEIIISLKA